jgi:sn-glycerol 3-phosphate transport system substrate-binding protein
VIPALRNLYTCRGDMASLPTVGTSFHLFTNVTLLRAAGIDEIPQTWQDLRAACERIVAVPGGPPHGIVWANNGINFQHAMAVQGGQLADNGNGRLDRAERVDLTTKEMMAWVEFWRKLHEDGLYHYTGELADWTGTLALFTNQQTAFRLSSSNDILASAQAAEESGFELAVTRFPYNAEVPYQGNVAAGTSLWLADGLDKATEDGALAFMQFLNSPRNAANRHQRHSFIPVTQSSFDLLEREGWFAEHPYHRAPNDQLAMSVGNPSSVGALLGDYFTIQEVMCEAMHDVLVHGVDSLERFTRATAQAQELLDRYLAEYPGPSPETQARAS